MIKKCTKCLIEKTCNQFSKDKNKKDGLYPSCKECYEKYYATVRDKRLAEKKEYREKNATEISEKRRAWYLRNRESACAYAGEWARNNLVSRRAAQAKRRSAKKRGIGASYTADDVARLSKMQRGKCACCNANISKSFHVDHIIPLSKGGGNGADNIQILCPLCNGRKKDKCPVRFMQEQGFLL